MRNRRFLVTVGDGYDPRPPEAQARSRRVAAAAKRELLRSAGVAVPSAAEQESSATAAEAESPARAMVKVWRLVGEGGGPLRTLDGGLAQLPVELECIHEFPAFGPMVSGTVLPEKPITAFAVLEDLSHTALGLQNGAVVLLRGNILRGERHCKRFLLQKELPSPVPVTALGFVHRDDPRDVAAAEAAADEMVRRQRKERDALDREVGGVGGR